MIYPPRNRDEYLDGKYVCYGHFYSINFQGEECKCRSVLEVAAKQIVPDYANQLLKKKPDAIFILLNAGSARPVGSNFNTIDVGAIETLNVELVQAYPDAAAYQLMRVMDKKNWNHIRVLTLSDFIESQKMGFYDYMKRIEQFEHGCMHSSFSKKREKELKRKMNIENPIYAGWGVDDIYDEMIKKCIQSLPKNTELKGITKKVTFVRYYQPVLTGKPFTQKEWVELVAEIA